MNRYNRRTVNIITPPAAPLFAPADLRSFLRTGAEDDALVAVFIAVATDAARQYLRRSLASETLELRMDAFSDTDEDALLSLGPGIHTGHYASFVSAGGEVELPFGPVSSIVSVTTWDRTNAPSVFGAGNYRHDADRITLNEGMTWPLNLRRSDAVAIRYVSGQSVGEIPEAIKQGVRDHVLVMFDCRAACDMPDHCKRQMAAYRRMDMLAWR